MSATVYLTLAAMLSRVLDGQWLRAYVVFIALLLAVIVGVNRIYLGVHWPSDVLAGWPLGASWSLLWSGIMLRLQQTHLVEQRVATGPDPVNSDSEDAVSDERNEATGSSRKST